MLQSIQRFNFKPRKPRLVIGILLTIGLAVAFLGGAQLIGKSTDKTEILVGMDIGFGDEEVALKIIDKVSNYVNLIILGSLNVTTNTEALIRVCDYIYQKNLYFIVYVGFGEEEHGPPRGPDSEFFISATNKYGDKFLGVYLFDEVGGKLIDGAHSIDVTESSTYSEAATQYTHHLNYFLGNVSKYYEPANLRLFTSDYALYWYDYLAGYDVIFGEFVGNQSREITVGLCRGAAKSLSKEWGVMITWSNNSQHFMEDPDKLYADMVLAYQNGAKYIVVFNSPGEYAPPSEYGALTLDHLDTMKKFWNFMKQEAPVEEYPANTAYVLPRDYGYGFRSDDDKIWGKWQSDALSFSLWSDLNNLLSKTVSDLDVVYETKIDNVSIVFPYEKLIFWNGTIVEK